jgi:hypothetical protein
MQNTIYVVGKFFILPGALIPANAAIVREYSLRAPAAFD